MILPRESSGGFSCFCLPVMTLSTRTETHAKLNAFLWPELKQEWQMSLILSYWVMTVISRPCSDVNLLTGRAGRWYQSSFLFHLQLVHHKVKGGISVIKQGMCFLFCIWLLVGVVKWTGWTAPDFNLSVKLFLELCVLRCAHSHTHQHTHTNTHTPITTISIFRNFPGGPVVKNPCFRWRGHRFNPWLGN